MKIIIISGFLGAGKTTFIKTMAEKTKKNFVVLENEFADISIDGPLLLKSLEEAAAEEAELPEDAKLWELTEGCICCSLQLNFSHSVLTIANTLNPDILVVEPSGVALLQSVVEQLQKICYENIRLLEPITIVDYQNYHESVRSYGDCVNDQIQGCGWIVFSKNEKVSADEMDGTVHALAIENPTASILTDHYSSFDENQWESFFQRYLGDSVEEAEERVSKPSSLPISSVSFVHPHMESIPQLIGALQVLISGCVGKVVRAKGFLPVQNEWIRFDLVHGLYEITGAVPLEEARIVIIGERLKRSSLKKLFAATIFTGDIQDIDHSVFS